MFTDGAGGNNNEGYDAFGECWSVVDLDGATPASQQNLSPMVTDVLNEAARGAAGLESGLSFFGMVIVCML